MTRLIIRRRKQNRNDYGYASQFSCNLPDGANIHLTGLPLNTSTEVMDLPAWGILIIVHVPFQCPHLGLESNEYNDKIVTLAPREWDELHDTFILDTRRVK